MAEGSPSVKSYGNWPAGPPEAPPGYGRKALRTCGSSKKIFEVRTSDTPRNIPLSDWECEVFGRDRARTSARTCPQTRTFRCTVSSLLCKRHERVHRHLLNKEAG